MGTGVPRGVLADVLAGKVRIGCGVADRVELVVSHHDLRGALIGHRFDEPQHFELLRPPVDEIPDEHRGPLGMFVDSVPLAIAHPLEQDA